MPAKSIQNPWLPILQPQPQAKSRLFCFPHAGGSAQAFRPWQLYLGPACEVCAVQPPGRWNRHAEPVISDLALLMDKAIEGLSGYLGGSYALFGHSVGSLVAFEFARALRRRNLPGPCHLFVSGRRAPHLPGLALKVNSLSDAALIAHVGQRYGAIPEPLLNDPDMLARVLPVLRSDLKLDELYQFVDEPPLSCPITVFGGASDSTTTPESLAAWQRHMSSSFRTRMFLGGHFFIDQERDALLQQVDRYWDGFAEKAM